MRTPNCACMVCAKPMYRRPGELARIRHVACMEHRAQAQSISGITDAQRVGLSKGSVPGTNHRNGYTHREESKAKASAAQKAWCAANPDKVAARSEKARGPSHYRWKGGSTKLNTSIRQMTENRRWMDAVKARDGKCTRCGSMGDLESHHKTGRAALIERLGIASRADARAHAAQLFDIQNGETLCRECHYIEHGRKHHAD